MGIMMKINKVNIIKLLRNILYAHIICLAYSCVAQAATGWCTTSGGVKAFSKDFSFNVADATELTAGKIYTDISSWSLGATYIASCDCTTKGLAYFKADTGALTQLLYSDSVNKFYKINDYIGVATSIYLAGYVKTYFPTPFFDETSNAASECVGSTFSTGSQGKISLYINKPFIGSVTIPSTVITRIYGTHTKGSYPSEPLAQVNLSGVITMPQSCKINDGQIIDIDYGNIMSTNMETKGAGPKGFSAVVTQVAYICTNIAQGVKIAFTFTGQASPDDTDSLKTDNPDLGIHLEDMNGKTIAPNNGKLSTQFDYATQKGSSTFKSYPVNTTGNRPEPGPFTSTATITTNIE